MPEAHKHEFTPIAPECPHDETCTQTWEWCIRCGTLKLGDEIFTPGEHQQEVIMADKSGI